MERGISGVVISVDHEQGRSLLSDIRYGDGSS